MKPGHYEEATMKTLSLHNPATAPHWELVIADGTIRQEYPKTQFTTAMSDAADFRKQGVVCDVRRIKAGR